MLYIKYKHYKFSFIFININSIITLLKNVCKSMLSLLLLIYPIGITATPSFTSIGAQAPSNKSIILNGCVCILVSNLLMVGLLYQVHKRTQGKIKCKHILVVTTISFSISIILYVLLSFDNICAIGKLNSKIDEIKKMLEEKEELIRTRKISDGVRDTQYRHQSLLMAQQIQQNRACNRRITQLNRRIRELETALRNTNPQG